MWCWAECINQMKVGSLITFHCQLGTEMQIRKFMCKYSWLCRLHELWKTLLHVPSSSLDINECSRKNGGCSHLCLNQKGGYKCACPASHRLSPYSWKKCLPRTTTTSNTADWAGKKLVIDEIVSPIEHQLKLWLANCCVLAGAWALLCG